MFNFLPHSCLLSVSVEREQEGDVNINRGTLSSPCDPGGSAFPALTRGVVRTYS